MRHPPNRKPALPATPLRPLILLIILLGVQSTGQAAGPQLEARQWHQSALSREEEPIVIHSVHSSSDKPDASAGRLFPTALAPPSNDDSRLQPSQEFESQTMGPRQQQPQQSRWPQRPSPGQSQRGGESAEFSAHAPLPARDHLATSGAGAPYAMSQQPAEVSQGQRPQVAPSAALWRQQQAFGPPSREQGDPYSSQQASRQQATMWMQSVRDNHNGPLRSRFNLSQQHATDDSNSSNYFADRAKRPLAQAASQAAPDASVSQHQAGVWSRRNSKFTRSNEEPTTPLEATPTTSTSRRPNLDVDLTQRSLPEEPSVETRTDPLAGPRPLHQRLVYNLSAPQHQRSSTDFDPKVLLLSNNHADLKIRQAANKTHKQRETLVRMARSLPGTATQDEGMVGAEDEARSAGQADGVPKTRRTIWSRILPNVIQRAIGSMISRLTEPNQVGKLQTPPMVQQFSALPSGHHPEHSPLLAHQPMEPHGLPSMIRQPSSLLNAAVHLAENIDHLQLGGRQSMASSQHHERRVPSLRHHANKKIIDSSIDLPVSERRSDSTHEATEQATRRSRTFSHWKVAESDSPDYQEGTVSRSMGSDADSLDADDEGESLPIIRSVDFAEDRDNEDEEPTDTRGQARFYSELGEMRSGVSDESDMQPADEHERSAASQPTELTERLLFYAAKPLGAIRDDQADEPEPDELVLEPRQQPSKRKPSVQPSGRQPPASSHKIRVQPARPDQTRPPQGSFSVSRPQQSAAPKPMGVLGASEQTDRKSMLAPMSSSINVLDLDPSLTQLAHNKLIVAKHKQRKSKPKQPAPRPRPTGAPSSQPVRPRTPTTPSSSTTRRPATSQQPSLKLSTTSSPKSGSLAIVGSSLASAILNSEVITNNHIRDTLSRWTRPPATDERKPPSVASYGLRVVSDLLKPSASGLIGRVSAPTNPMAAPNSQGDYGQSAQSPQEPQSGSAATSKPEASPTRVAPAALISGNKNEKFNFSIMTMNNRERVNPILFPPEGPRYPGNLQNSSASSGSNAQRRPSTQRIRYTTTTTTTTTTSTTTTTTPAPPSYRPGRPPGPGIRPSRPTQQANRTSTRRPLPPVPLLNLATRRPVVAGVQQLPPTDEDFGQILRSQHKNRGPQKQQPPPPMPLSESQRLRNQYLSLIGHNVSLDGRNGVPSGYAMLQSLTKLLTSSMMGGQTLSYRPNSLPAPTEMDNDDQHLSGHISLVTRNLLANDQKVGFGPAGSLEEAASDANRYTTITNGTEFAGRMGDLPSTSMPSQQVNETLESDQSIVIMNDNHHSTTARRQPPLMPTTQRLPTAEEQKIAPQRANQYLNELVQGSRIRPSSAAKLGIEPATPRDPTPEEEGTILASAHSLNPGGDPLVVGPKGAPGADSSVGKLDARAQELLQNMFDRDPSYMSGLFEAALKPTVEREVGSEPAGNRSTEESRRVISEQQMEPSEPPVTTPPDTLITHYTLADTVGLSASTVQLTSDMDQSVATPEYTIEGLTGSSESNESPSPTDEQATSALAMDTTTPLPSEGLDTRSEAQDPKGPKHETIDQVGATNLNKRISMRHNQGVIQSILAAYAQKHHLASPTQPSIQPDEIPTQQTAPQDQESMGANQEQAQNSLGDFVAGVPVLGSTQSESATQAPSSETTASSNEELDAHTLASILDKEITKLYSSTKIMESQTSATTMSSAELESGATEPLGPVTGTPPTRQPTIELLSFSRQKINRPSTESSVGYHPLAGSGGSSMNFSIGPVTQPTNKLTESPSNDEILRQVIKNRISSTSTTTEMPLEPSTTVISTTVSEPATFTLSISGPSSGASFEVTDDDEHEQYQPIAIGWPPQKPRPVIVRKRPRPHQAHKNKPRGQLSSQAKPSKKRKRPALKPNQIKYHMTTSTADPYGSEADRFLYEAMAGTNADDSLDRPTLVILPPRHVTQSSKKRPAYVRLPPNSIRIHDYRNKTRVPMGQSTNNLGQAQFARPGHDIRTRPLTIVDSDPAQGQESQPSGGSSHQLASEGLFGMPSPPPETTIVHDKMVVTYKPGRPNTVGYQIMDAASDNSTGTTASVHQTRKPQLGSGNGGDTHLVSIEQQLQQLRQQSQGLSTTERPSSEMSHEFQLLTQNGTTTKPQRQIILINGLMGAGGSAGTRQPPDSTSPNHPAPSHRPRLPQTSGSALVEASSLSVMAQAAHGLPPNLNQTRPWPGATGQHQLMPPVNVNSPVGRHNMSLGGHSNATDSETLVSSSSDSMTTGEMFGEPASSTTSWPSGSYQNHNQQQSQHQHLGMPFMGPSSSGSSSTSTGSRPTNRWRVRKRPNGNAGSPGASHEPATSSSTLSLSHRPTNGQLFNFTSMMNLYENLRLFLSRFRAFIISMMVMFLPPLALAASVVNAMSS